MKKVTVPVGFLNVVAGMYSEWNNHADNLPEKYPGLNQGFEVLYEMLEEKFEAKKRRDEYIAGKMSGDSSEV